MVCGFVAMFTHNCVAFGIGVGVLSGIWVLICLQTASDTLLVIRQRLVSLRVPALGQSIGLRYFLVVSERTLREPSACPPASARQPNLSEVLRAEVLQYR